MNGNLVCGDNQLHDVKVKNGSPWPEAVLISFSLFVQEAEEEGVAGGTTNKLVCAPVVLETNLGGLLTENSRSCRWTAIR